jgi:phenylacetate-CoA ligase
MQRYLDALQGHRIKYLLGYASALHELAEGALHLHRHLEMKVAIVNAEPLLDHQRRAIEEAFQCPVRETYGMAETVAAASECEHGVLHLWPEAGDLEVLEATTPAAKGQAGELISTGLVNPDMPLIRYRTGDRVALSGKESNCACGRTLPTLAFVEGRVDDLLYTRDGRRVGRLDPIFKGQLPVREAQIIQETLDQIRVRYVPASDFTSSACNSIAERVRARMGDVRVILEEVGRVPRGANGKFHSVVCKLSQEQIESVRMNSSKAMNVHSF